MTVMGKRRNTKKLFMKHIMELQKLRLTVRKYIMHFVQKR